jgi:UDP-N-acetylmuramoyl-L-alanyl-D-glutamate--2,6-diaminopimelate ligase
MKQNGVTHVFAEFSSHALKQKRGDGTHLSGASFSNLTRDHMDYFKTMAEQKEAKFRFFSNLFIF